MTYEETFRRARVFFLGAGFSAGAGVPLTDELLPRAASLFRNEAPGLYERVNNFASDVDVDLTQKPNAEQFARLCTHLDFMELREYGGGERWSDRGSRERLALKFFLSKAIATATPKASDLPEFYTRFAHDLSCYDIIVTFNWDVLLEKSLAHIGKEFSYTWEEGKVLILKLHGSINWISGKPRAMARGARSFSYQSIGYANGIEENDVFYSQTLHECADWATARCLVDEVQPLIVLPGYGKAVDVRLLSAIWYRPEFLNRRLGGISVIGLSVAQDDYIIESLFRYLFRSAFDEDQRVRVLNPDLCVGEKFKELASALRIEFMPKKLANDTVDWAMFRDLGFSA